MKKSLPAICIIAAIVLLSYSCRKGELAPERYQAGVVVKSSQLSTTDLDVRFDTDDDGDELVAGGTIDKLFELKDSLIKSGKRTSLRIYKAGTSDLIADTSFVLQKDQQKIFNVVYSDVLDMGGFLNGTDVPQDSIRIRVVYRDKTAAQQFGSLEWGFYQYSDFYPYVDTMENAAVVLPLQKDRYSVDFQIPVYKRDGSSTTHLFARIKDPVTGNWLLWFPDVPAFEVHMDGGDLGGGSYYFFTLNLLDNYTDAGVNYYQVDYSYLKL